MSGDVNAAAETIRNALDRLMAHDSLERPHVNAGLDAVDALVAEVERLQAENTYCGQHIAAMSEEMERLRAERACDTP